MRGLAIMHVDDAGRINRQTQRIPSVITALDSFAPVHNRGRKGHRRKAEFNPRRDFLDQWQPVAGLDAAANGFFQRQLIHLIPGMFETDYFRLNARMAFPVYFGNDPGAASIAWRTSDEYAQAEIVADYANNPPMAETSGDEIESKVRGIWQGYQWNIQELRAAAKAQEPLTENKMAAARRAMLRRENAIAWNGDSRYRIEGLFTDSDIPRDTAGTTFKGAASAAAVVTALHNLAHAIVDNTEEEEPDTLALPTEQFNYCAATRVGTDGNAPTILQDFLQNQTYITSVIRVRELNGAGTGGVDVAVAYERNINKLRLNVMLDVEMWPQYRRHALTQGTLHMRTGGVLVHRPLSVRMLEGI